MKNRYTCCGLLFLDKDCYHRCSWFRGDNHKFVEQYEDKITILNGHYKIYDISNGKLKWDQVFKNGKREGIKYGFGICGKDVKRYYKNDIPYKTIEKKEKT